jgi:hypothetical protein
MARRIAALILLEHALDEIIKQSKNPLTHGMLRLDNTGKPRMKLSSEEAQHPAINCH